MKICANRRHVRDIIKVQVINCPRNIPPTYHAPGTTVEPKTVYKMDQVLALWNSSSGKAREGIKLYVRQYSMSDSNEF